MYPTCPECSAVWINGQTCLDHFHLLLAWEWEYQRYDVHHLLVLNYHLQHPNLYSPEMLRMGKGMLVDFIEGDVSPQQMRQRLSRAVDSGTRPYKIAGTPDAHGSYANPVRWDMHTADVVRAGADHYYDRVRQWASSILASLRLSSNLE